jgi:hypothetical protein
MENTYDTKDILMENTLRCLLWYMQYIILYHKYLLYLQLTCIPVVNEVINLL